MNGWWRITQYDDEGRVLGTYVLPVEDLRPHEEGAECWCGPTKDPDFNLWLHHSMDRREEYENGRKAS